jgi:DNA-binding MarR family transcriptional regulator
VTAGPTTARPGDARLAAWRAFLMAHSLVSRRLDDELRVEHGLSLAEYDAQLQLAQAPDRRLRMNQLAERVILSRSGVTRLVDRLEADGLVSRRSCSSDARGAEAVLTDTGLDRLRTASATHLRGVERYFLDALTGDELGTVEHALGAVIDRSARGTTFEGCNMQTIAVKGRPA